MSDKISSRQSMVLKHIQVNSCNIRTADLYMHGLSVARVIWPFLLWSTFLCAWLAGRTFVSWVRESGQPQRPTNSSDTQRRHHCHQHPTQEKSTTRTTQQKHSGSAQISTDQHSSAAHPDLCSHRRPAQPPQPQPPPWTSMSPAGRSHSRCRWRAGTRRDENRGDMRTALDE
jgi:cytoskeletal protein RodZ